MLFIVNLNEELIDLTWLKKILLIIFYDSFLINFGVGYICCRIKMQNYLCASKSDVNFGSNKTRKYNLPYIT
jgi:hypothetical protein